MLRKAARKRPDLEGSSAVKAPSRLVGGRRLQHPALLALLCNVLLTSAQAPAASSLNGVSSVVRRSTSARCFVWRRAMGWKWMQVSTSASHCA